jgi:hypothetical protein
VSVAPKLTIFGGSLFNFSFGGRGRGRGKGGLLKRAAGLVSKGLQEMRSPTAGKISPAEKGRSFDDFRQGRPDLFEPPELDSDVDDDQGDEDAAAPGGPGAAPGGAPDGEWPMGCSTCGAPPGGGHRESCAYGWHA